jgi:FKBP-type peptidyl-prolyl cis-trans isomerase
MKKISFIVLVLLVILGLQSCNTAEKPKQKSIQKAVLDRQLEQINKAYIEKEDVQIDDYLNRRHWNFERTASGLRYFIYQKGLGKSPTSENTVVLDYEISLIRGEVIYSSKQLGEKVFVVDNSEEPSGLHEAVKMLKVGDRAKLVIPSYLAYGLLGDDDKIPMKATLFYDVYLREVK